MLQHTSVQLLHAVVCVTALGCAVRGVSEPVPNDDRSVYTKALDATTGSPTERLTTCRQIGEPQLRGDCTLSIAQSMARGSADGALAWCPHAEAGTWRDECHFAAAESAAMRGDDEGARSLCKTSGIHQDRCWFHLFQLDTQQTAPQVPNDPKRAAEILQALHFRHKRSPEHAGSHHVRRAWYRQVADVHQINDIAWCTSVFDRDRQDCEHGVTEAVRKRERKVR